MAARATEPLQLLLRLTLYSPSIVYRSIKSTVRILRSNH